MTEQEIFEKLKDALDNNYLQDSWGIYDKDADNLEDYLKLIKSERAIEKDLRDNERNEFVTYQKFISYLSDKSIGDTSNIIEEFNNCTYVNFEGYKQVTREIINNELYLVFKVKETKFKAHWQASDNYAVWQTCGICGDDYSGYMLFPTYKKDEYFCLSYQC